MINTSTPEKAGLLGFCESPVAQMVLRYRRVIESNKAIERLFGFRRDDLVGRSVQRLYPSTADFERIGEVCEAGLRRGENNYYEDKRFMQTRDGQVFWARARGITLSPEDPFALMIWSFDRIEKKTYQSVNLTPREREIAPLIGQGLTSKQIGERLGISHRTVETHRARLMKKFGVHNTAELVSQIVIAI
ncbi:LuxR family transcriptional regulator [Salipiger aestuarii]|uniref:PAS domain S-box-containing protein n=1 Tax=Salipiger aestuarii TaxID=568098 RepID=A0A327Y3P3_9RHOB|nr:PAS and helix-turn-helix domain-containing protein [Salipiger aestuarii]KAA8607675.1 LuxR family transcriptional regulator [Salipiger aestuarii]KAA8611135.1 LuxR family transcriptional regulator [Salipiger aestuarii]KAB2541902.1 LuxR family transcriptional regulator [Salipiger aestuarii]RAK15364.1 PAS domain S-box-containing protein [Salipiger aestuarii]